MLNHGIFGRNDLQILHFTNAKSLIHTSCRLQQLLQRARSLQIIGKFSFFLPWIAPVAGCSRASLNVPQCTNEAYLVMDFVMVWMDAVRLCLRCLPSSSRWIGTDGRSTCGNRKIGQCQRCFPEWTSRVNLNPADLEDGLISDKIQKPISKLDSIFVFTSFSRKAPSGIFYSPGIQSDHMSLCQWTVSALCWISNRVNCI